MPCEQDCCWVEWVHRQSDRGETAGKSGTKCTLDQGRNGKRSIEGFQIRESRSDLWVRKVFLDFQEGNSFRQPSPPYSSLFSFLCLSQIFCASQTPRHTFCTFVPLKCSPPGDIFPMFKAWLDYSPSRNPSLSPNTCSLLPSQNPGFSPK